MTPEELFNNLGKMYSSSISSNSDFHENFGIGAKITTAMWNPYGVVFCSWHKDNPDEGHLLWLHYNENFNQICLKGIPIEMAIDDGEGGIDIEEVAAETPEKIITVDVNPSTGLEEQDIISISKALGLEESLYAKSADLLKNLYKAFTETDMSLLEINPLVLTGEDDLICLDAKVNFDGNALFRHPDVEELRDPDEEDPAELAANKIGLTYIKLDGNIGCLVNGAGLAMATMDIIKLYGEEPANFLDVGGSATKDKVTEAFKIILSDKNVKGILVNIFGGIMRCDVVAEGVLDAAREINISVPLVVRLEGTNVEEGKRIIEESELKVISGSDLDDAAQKITKAISEVK